MVQAVCLHWLSQGCEHWNLPFSPCLPHFLWSLCTSSETLALASGTSLGLNSAQAPCFPSDMVLPIRLCLPELGWLSPKCNTVCLHWFGPVHDVSHLSILVEPVGVTASLFDTFARNTVFYPLPYTHLGPN